MGIRLFVKLQGEAPRTLVLLSNCKAKLYGHLSSCQNLDVRPYVQVGKANFGYPSLHTVRLL